MLYIKKTKLPDILLPSSYPIDTQLLSLEVGEDLLTFQQIP